MKRILALILLFGFKFNIKAQSDNDTIKTRNLLFLSVGYQNVFSGKVLPINGTSSTLSINPFEFLDKNYFLGPLIEFRVFNDLGFNKSYSNLASEVNNNIILNQTNSNDSLLVTSLLKGFNNDSKVDFSGSYCYAYGILYRPNLGKYGGLFIQVKRGKYILPMYNRTIQTNSTDTYFDLEIPVNCSILVGGLPFYFMKDSRFQFFNF